MNGNIYISSGNKTESLTSTTPTTSLSSSNSQLIKLVVDNNNNSNNGGSCSSNSSSSSSSRLISTDINVTNNKMYHIFAFLKKKLYDFMIMLTLRKCIFRTYWIHS